MTSEQRQLRQTVIFLRTSFEAVQHSIAGRLEDPLPCWMDTSMLSMLSRELTRCCQQSKPLFAPAVTEQLYIASQQCELLLKQCPGVLSSAVCYRQLGAIMLPLSSALQQIDTPAKRRWPWAKWN
ncbi:hypothetical protein E0L35_00480 [Halomonas sp. ATBC28]|uniref:hypothetical protein n=1 Tax=Halomonadaceae TaxID=28256 RepID=UPI000C6C3223|nr:MULTISPECIES: hypothetical protein [unclassified Halomonas]MBF57348.1 hypothetical protein [Halomonas sp.]TMU28629.1 hypothetical protein E0L35_00480 [Halomonas sp. ATBC28]UBR51456.1 hypothetical protein KF947_08245 [Halomonas sp. FeN2]|tara:strand:+ start:2521 stop:2895 length:375 start_codon:yes stop_codon:yes gene_type:complete